MNKVLSLLILLPIGLLLSCSEAADPTGFTLNGAWTLIGEQHPDGESFDIAPEDTWLRIYDDSCYYECRVTKAPNGTLISPSEMEMYTLVDRGKHTYLYLQGDNTYPFTYVDDSTITVQETGRKFTWRLSPELDADRTRSIVGLIKREAEQPADANTRYVFSNAEDKLQSENSVLTYGYVVVAIVVLLILNYSYITYRKKKRIEQELQQIREERQALPQPIREAMNTVEDDFHHSPFYVGLRKRITNGDRLTEQDWDDIEEHFKSVYPRFTSTLLSLRSMSQVELQVCQLLKLRVPPSEIAGVLCKDTSSISSIRSRLYKKVFGGKASSKEWDEFILSL